MNFTRGEYIFDVDLGSTQKARNVLNIGVQAQAADSLTWTLADFPWTDDQAVRPWENEGDVEAVEVRPEIAVFSGPDATQVEQFKFNNSLTGINATNPATSGNITYQQGRFNAGVYLTDVGTLTYSIAIPSSFALTFWARPKFTGESTVICRLTGVSGDLEVIYDSVAKLLKLVDDSGNEVVAGNGVESLMETDSNMFIGVVQTSTTRKIMVGLNQTRSVYYGESALAPVGAFNTLVLA